MIPNADTFRTLSGQVKCPELAARLRDAAMSIENRTDIVVARLRAAYATTVDRHGKNSHAAIIAWKRLNEEVNASLGMRK